MHFFAHMLRYSHSLTLKFDPSGRFIEVYSEGSPLPDGMLQCKLFKPFKIYALLSAGNIVKNLTTLHK